MIWPQSSPICVAATLWGVVGELCNQIWAFILISFLPVFSMFKYSPSLNRTSDATSSMKPSLVYLFVHRLLMPTELQAHASCFVTALYRSLIGHGEQV